MIGYEQDTIQFMRDGQNKYGALASFVTRREIEKDHPHLSQSQRAAVEQILAKPGSGHGNGRRCRLWENDLVGSSARSC